MANASKAAQIQQAKDEATALRELADARAAEAQAALDTGAAPGVQANLAKMAAEADKVAKAAEAALLALETGSNNTSGLTASIGFVLTKALLNDPTYGQGPGGLQEVYDLWESGDETAALNAYFQTKWYTK